MCKYFNVARQLEADIECSFSHGVFNIKKRLTDRVMPKFRIDGRDRVLEARVTEYILLVRNGN